MRIAFAIQNFSETVGGAEFYAHLVTRGLADRGHEIHVVTEDGHAPEEVTLHIAKLETFEMEAAKLSPHITIDWGLKVYSDLHWLGGGVHKEYMNYNILGRSRLGRFLKRLEYMFAPKHRKTIRRQEEVSQVPDTYFIAVSHFAGQQLRQTVPVSSDRIIVIPNGVPLSKFGGDKLKKFRSETRTRLGLAEDNVAFLFVAHNLRLKNFNLLERAFHNLANQLPNARLIVIGKQRPKTKNPYIIYAGKAAEPERFYAAADTLLHPTYFDPCAGVVLEALAAGLPVVSSDLNGSAELIDHGRNGFVLPVTGPPVEIEAQWKNVISRLVENPEERRNIGKLAQEVGARHSMDNYLMQFESCIQQIAGKLGRI